MMDEDLASEIELAGKGDPIAAAKVAMSIHLHPGVARSLGVESRYPGLLHQALQSNNPEFLVTVGEELYAGKSFAPDRALAKHFFRRADELSSFMGSYAEGRLLCRSSPSVAIELLGKGNERGHIPSMMLRHQIIVRRLGWFGPIASLCYFLLHWLVITRAIGKADMHVRFWRYRDFAAEPFEIVDKAIGTGMRKSVTDFR